jgi:pyridoxine 4-dehydrogenase
MENGHATVSPPRAGEPGSTVTIGSGLEVGRVGYGAMRLTGDHVWGDYPDREGGLALLRDVVDAGITFIDTADVYGPHSNEILIHDALHPYPRGLVIATKGGFVRGGYDYSTLDAVGNRNYLRQSAQLSARRLGVEQIDLYYLHSGRATDVPFEDQVATLAELREQGLIANIGLSNVTIDQFHAARAIVSIAAVTAHYNPAVRVGAGLLDAAEKAGAVFSPWHPVTTTETGDPHVTNVLELIARQHEATIAQIALAWQLHRSPASLPIPGTTSRSHLAENLAAGAIRLAPAEVQAIADVAPEG